MSQEWREQAACLGTDPEAWFGDDQKERFQADSALKRICASCPVQDECLSWAVRHEANGFWAGTMPRERRAMRGRLGIVLEAPEVMVLGHIFAQAS